MNFSIVIPSFNQGPYIGKTITSILQQRWQNTEIIVIDGGSTDGTVDVVKEFGNKISTFISEPDRGQTHAINKGLKFATGDVIGWINSDDIYLPNCFNNVARAFKRFPACDVVHGDRVLIASDGSVFGWTCGTSFQPHRYGYNVCSETAFWRRSSTKAPPNGLKEDLRFAMDLQWFGSFYARGATFKKLNVFLGAFRCHSANKSSTLQDVCSQETQSEWTHLFGNGNWAVDPPRRKIASLCAPLLNLRIVGSPYFNRRFIQGKRGI